ncbi:Alpha/Beta hydrolase protein [Mycena amicta]|nr:Alpha/Beta hydrolase protein [Mycena amicta]
MQLLKIGLILSSVSLSALAKHQFNLKPFTINLSTEFARIKTQVQHARLPETELYPGNADHKGVPLDVLKSLKEEWATTYDWEKEQAKLNAWVSFSPVYGLKRIRRRYDHFKADVEGLSVHFIHQKSKERDAIPIILLHGWPGSFQEFLPVVTPLTQKNGSSGVAYNVVVPSLPGFTFSSAPVTQNWTTADTARIFKTLMTDVLGYEKFVVHGTDWGSSVGYALYTTYHTSVLSASFDFVPFFPPTRDDIVAANITLLPEQEITLARQEEWIAEGMDYLLMLTHKPNDIGYALYDNPVGQLAWIGGKFLLWSQPDGSLSKTTVLTAVSLYVLTDSVVSAGWIYAANPTSLNFVYVYPGPGTVDDAAPMVFSHFAYNVGLWPKEWVSKVGNLVDYRVHAAGGHFAGLDNPVGLVEDIRELGNYLQALN